ncbi:TetR/AcrR family transcriptional regulator [Amycolatopsis sp. CA-230715]|uniref:TetR/AcrR family transcriptional regulator n=1 Tax=Amycolatopsis sp. CA-230715 TaxID=2745196 RepID=UPI001C0213D8|nr:TetR family transcriptional regulator [Amycolatopsis sp. CA-230715]
MTSFKRARSEEQRVERRRKILDTADAMLAEMPVSQLSLNELSRRVCLAKSNVLRYFESREAVLLELLDRATREWLIAITTALEDGVDAEKPLRERGDQVAAVMADSLAAHPRLCDLVSAQASVLEHNVSPAAVAKYKHALTDQFSQFATVLLRHVPELGEDAMRFVAMGGMVAGTIWTHARPSAAVLAAYEADPELAAWRIDFVSTLRETLSVLLTGFLARSAGTR